MTCQCKHCAKALGALPETAPHKRFCSAKCRQQFHADRRRAAQVLLAELDADGTVEAVQRLIKEFRHARQQP
jgi:hypothetical protein